MPKISNVLTWYFDHFTGLPCSSAVRSTKPQQPKLLFALHAYGFVLISDYESSAVRRSKKKTNDIGEVMVLVVELVVLVMVVVVVVVVVIIVVVGLVVVVVVVVVGVMVVVLLLCLTL